MKQKTTNFLSGILALLIYLFLMFLFGSNLILAIIFSLTFAIIEIFFYLREELRKEIGLHE